MRLLVQIIHSGVHIDLHNATTNESSFVPQQVRNSQILQIFILFKVLYFVVNELACIVIAVNVNCDLTIIEDRAEVKRSLAFP